MLTAPMTWTEYQARSKQGAHGGYHPSASEEASLSFSRLAQGDQFVVRVVVISVGPPLRARVTFTASAD